MTTELKLVDGGRPLGRSGCSVDSGRGACVPEREVVVFAVGGRSSGTVDCLFARVSSSASSAISINRLRRKELVDEDVDPDAVCREHAAERVVSRSSFAVVMGNTVSWGENRSVTALKCTVTRATEMFN